MNIAETSQALALAQAFDNRTVGEVNVRAWHAVLGDLDAGRVMEAIRRHYNRTTDWLMPAHVRRIVGEIEQGQAKAGRRWAAGQAGVPADSPMPELENGWAKAGFPPDVQALIDEVRDRLAARHDGDRAKLFPRQTYWEREHRAYLRAHSGEPNPLYRPTAGWVNESDQVPPTGRDYMPLSRPSAGADTGILPNAYRCTDCTFTTADADRMDSHMAATGHRCGGLDE